MWSQAYLPQLPKGLYMFYLQAFESIAGLDVELKHIFCFAQDNRAREGKIIAQEKVVCYIEVKN